MKKSIIVFLFSFILLSCEKENEEPDRVVNGVNVNVAVSTFNSYRTEGIEGYPSVEPLVWNDTLSLAAYNFAKAKTEDVNTPSNVYILSNGQMVLEFPAALNFSRAVTFGFYYGYPADADVKTVVDAGFEVNDPLVLAGLMNATTRQFGMGQFGDKWYLIMSN